LNHLIIWSFASLIIWGRSPRAAKNGYDTLRHNHNIGVRKAELCGRAFPSGAWEREHFEIYLKKTSAGQD
jgi:hypothetical protein